MSEDAATWEPAVRPELWTAATRAAVERAYETAEDPETRTRAQMVLLTDERGLRPAEIAELVRRSAVTVRRVLRRFADVGLGALARGHGGGRSPVVTPAWEAELVRVIEVRPRAVGAAGENWTTATLAEYLGEAVGVRARQEAVREHLHRLGYVCKRPTWSPKRRNGRIGRETPAGGAAPDRRAQRAGPARPRPDRLAGAHGAGGVCPRVARRHRRVAGAPPFRRCLRAR